jgi:NADP-dependent 3-hydroxy acid dehydrogenase YdfG
MKCDVADETQSTEFIQFALKKHSNIDLFILNAGIGGGIVDRKFDRLETKEWKEVVNVNLVSTMNFTHQLIPIFEKQVNGGHIVFVQGFGGTGRKQEGFTTYGTTKYALTYFMDSLVGEYKDTNIGFHSMDPNRLKKFHG